MKDALLEFGALTALSSSASYCEHTLDFGEREIGENNEVKFVGSYPAKVVFVATAACAAFVPTLYGDAESDAPTTAIASGPAVDLADGESVELALPLKAPRYMRAGGTGDSGAVMAYIEMGGISSN